MGKKQPNTPRSRVRSCLRQLWLRSRERQAVLKKADRRCTRCNAKGSVAKGREVKIEVHHEPPIADAWEEIIDLIFEKILDAPQFPLCHSCHVNLHDIRKRRESDKEND